jgi:hypothetical protein
VRVFMLSPHGKMSPFQRAQMFSLQDPNIFNIAVEGLFDDCQDMVKAVSNDHAFKAQYKIGAVNSINWARVVAQIVYYFKGYFAATISNDEQVAELNGSYRGKPKPTNVLSFPAVPMLPVEGEPRFLGDIVLALKHCSGRRRTLVCR